MGLQLNAKKTELMTFNINEKAKITTKNGTILAVKEDFKYLGSYISSTEKDIWVRKAHAWRALHDLKIIWHSAMPDDLKRAIFMASVESILLYGSEAWTLTAVQEAWLDGCYTSMLRMVFNVTWRDRVRNEVIYGDLPLKKSGREDFEWQDTVSDTLNWLQATSFYGNRRRDEFHEAASL